MKIKHEFDLKLLEETVDVYRLGKTRDLLNVIDIKYKKESKNVGITFQYPKTNISALKSKNLNTDKLTLTSQGFSPLSNYFSITVDNGRNLLNLRKINNFYLFQNNFSYLEKKQDNQTDGFQFRKIESREEIEHRKQNINYKLRCVSLEDTKLWKVIDASRELEDGFKYLTIEDKDDISFTDTLKRVTKSIHKAVVVNLKDLVNLFEDLDLVREALAKNTFYFNGRYVLKSSFDPEDLQSIRKTILDKLKRKGFVLMTDIESNTFLIEELCDCHTGSPKYYLKGYFEEQDPKVFDKTISDEERVVAFIAQSYFCTLNDIVEGYSLDLDTVKRILFGDNIVSVGSNVYTVLNTEEEHVGIKQEIIKLIQTKKSYRKGEMAMAIENISKALSLDTNIVSNCIEKVFINKRGVWTVKDSFR